MRLEVPFFKQTTDLNCGPVALKMGLAYFGNNLGVDILEESTRINEGKGISTIQIAIAAKSLGYKVDFYSKKITFNEDNLKHEFYQKYSEINKEKSNKLLEKARKQGVNVQEKTLSLKEILKYVTKNSIPIILLDWNIVKSHKSEGYQGHFVPIVGYDKDYIYVHNHGFSDTKEFMPIYREVFDCARKAEGTDEDIVIVYKKE